VCSRRSTRCALRVLAEIDEVRAAVDARQLAAYAGLTPRERTSGSSVHRPPRLAKTGNSRLRRALYLPAIVAMRHNPAVRALAERLRARGKRPMVIVGAAMRKLLHLIYGVLKSGKPFDPALAAAA
jgi:transposase